MNTHDKIELPEHDCLYESTNEQGYIDLEPAYRKSTVLRLLEADRKRIAELEAELQELQRQWVEHDTLGCPTAKTGIYASEADRKRRTPPNEPFAIVIDRMYEGEGPSLAYWNGENYQFSDGDCYNREGDTLDGYTAEFLTDHQLEKRLFDDRKRRGEPVKLDRYDAGYLGGQDGMPAYVWHDIIRSELDRAYDFYMDQIDRAAPQPAEPVGQHPDDAAVDAFATAMKAKLKRAREEKGRGGWQDMSATVLSDMLREHVEKGDPVDVANLAMMLHQNGQLIEPAEPVKCDGNHGGPRCADPECWNDSPAEPVKVPSDDEIMSVVRYSTVGSAAIQDDEWCAFARALLARYGQQAQPTSCQNESMGEHACSDRSQCWEPCGDLGKSEEHARVYDPPVTEQEEEAWQQMEKTNE